MFGYKPREDLWEPAELRFSPELFSYSTVNLSKLANLSLYMAYNKVTELAHSLSLEERSYSFKDMEKSSRRANYI